MFARKGKHKNKYMEVLFCVKQSAKVYHCEGTRTRNHLVRKQTFKQFDLTVECSFMK